MGVAAADAVRQTQRVSGAEHGVQVFGVIVVEAVVFLALIALVYRRQEI